MKNLNKKLAICLAGLLIISNSVVFAKPNYSYTINTPVPTQKYTQNTIQIDNTSYKNSIEQSYTNNISYNTNTVLTGSVSKSNKLDGKTISDIDAKHYVNTIGAELKKNANIDKRMIFTYSKEKIENASTAITGTITVYRGIIDNCEYEDELAFIIGHEIAHAADYDCIKNSAASLATNAASGLTMKIVLDKTDNVWTALGSGFAVGLAGYFAENKYSRINEKDADLMAVDYLVQSGYNPLAGISILYKIGKNFADFFSTHPSTDKRIANVYEYIKQTYPQYITQSFDTDAYTYAIEEMLFAYNNK